MPGKLHLTLSAPPAHFRTGVAVKRPRLADNDQQVLPWAKPSVGTWLAPRLMNREAVVHDSRIACGVVGPPLSKKERLGGPSLVHIVEATTRAAHNAELQAANIEYSEGHQAQLQDDSWKVQQGACTASRASPDHGTGLAKATSPGV